MHKSALLWRLGGPKVVDSSKKSFYHHPSKLMHYWGQLGDRGKDAPGPLNRVALFDALAIPRNRPIVFVGDSLTAACE